ncbi:membrane protein YczE [Kineococcus arenarius]|uniref:membrane protein YczE n=1 Tax=Kineococcus sp. SYSU DK007 TaxID=3383128 RepID=UPI003D7EFA0D
MRRAPLGRSRWGDRPATRSTRLLLGLVVFALALALLVRADLGLDPWTVFSAGLARHLGLTLGGVTVLTSVVVLLLWIPLRQRPGIGTVANALVVGPVLDLWIALLPAPGAPALRGLFLLAALALVAVGTGLYVGAGWGPGPRDGLMTGLAELGVPLSLARVLIEGSVLVAGWLLGGAVGVATVVFALAVGPLVGRALPRLALPPSPGADGGGSGGGEPRPSMS